MSISTYSELQTAVTNFLKLSGGVDYSSRIPEWISLAEAEINRKARCFRQQKMATVSYTSSNTARRILLPSDFIEALVVEVKTATDDDLKYQIVRYVPPDSMADKTTTTAGKPEAYTLRRGEIELNCKTSDALTIRFHYVGTWDIASDTTNWLLTRHPDVYLYGALSQGETFNYSDARSEMWKTKFRDALAQVNLVDERTRDDGEMIVDEAARMSSTGRAYNVFSDT